MYRLENNIIKTDELPLNEECVGGAGYFCFNFMKKNGHNIAQICASTGQEETYNSLLQRCIRTGITLQKMGIKKDDIVMFFSDITMNSCVPVIACFLIGAIPTYIETTFPAFDIINLIKNIHPNICLTTPDFTETIRNILEKENRITNIVTFDDKFFEPQADESQFTPVYVEDLQKTAIIHFSSGTTSFPKGICINHYRLVSRTLSFDSSYWREGEKKVELSLDSLYWGIVSWRLMTSIRAGISRIISPFDAGLKNIWYILEKYKVNVAYLIPWTVIDMVAHAEISKERNLENLTTILVVGSPLQDSYHKKLQMLLPKVDIFQLYGQTELGVLTLFRKTELHRIYNRTKPGCVGTPTPNDGVSFKVVDIENGQILGPNKRGHLLVKSKLVMNGYYNFDSSEQFDSEGWLKTGDLVYYDEDCCFFIVDRIKDTMKFRGWPVIPALLEKEILSHPAVKTVAVVGIPHETDEEHPLALVALHENCDSVTPIEIEKYVEERVPDNYRLRGGVKFVKDSFLKSGNKLKRFRLKQLVLSGKI